MNEMSKLDRSDTAQDAVFLHRRLMLLESRQAIADIRNRECQLYWMLLGLVAGIGALAFGVSDLLPLSARQLSLGMFAILVLAILLVGYAVFAQLRVSAHNRYAINRIAELEIRLNTRSPVKKNK
jgi:hypothetical protein